MSWKPYVITQYAIAFCLACNNMMEEDFAVKKILVTKEKGGVASTTTAVNLAAVLAERGYAVLLVDMDTRGDCAACLGLDPWPGLWAVMRGALDRGGPAAVGDGLEVARPGLHLVPTNTSGLLDVLHEAEQMPLAGLAESAE